MKTQLMIVGLFGVCLLSGLVSCSRQGADKTIGVKADDPEMTAAIEKARSSLPEFWRVLDHPDHGESGFCLKVMISEKDDVEHFWFAHIERKEGAIYGTVNNEPEFVKSVKLGQRMAINEADISDWMYVQNGKMHGNYTLRALFKEMPAAEVEKYKQMLADP